MKIIKTLASTTTFLGAVAILLSGCATVIGTNTEYKEWRGDNTFLGNGGAVEVVDNVEFWEQGEPNQPFKVIGLINQTKQASIGHGILFSDFNRDQILDIVKRENGDGVVTMNSQRFVSGYKTEMPMNQYGHAATSARYAEASVLAVFKYLDSTGIITGRVSSAAYQEIPLEKTFYIIESEKQTLTETNIQSLLERELESRGLHRIYSFNDADYLVEYRYSVGEDATSNNAGYPVEHKRSVVEGATSTTNYPRYFQVSVIDVPTSNREKKLVYSWQAEAYSSGYGKEISTLTESVVPEMFEHYGQTVNNEPFRKITQ